MYPAKIRFKDHGLKKNDVGSIVIYDYENKRLRFAMLDEVNTNAFGYWSQITKIIDKDHFECFSGDPEILCLATEKIKFNE